MRKAWKGECLCMYHGAGRYVLRSVVPVSQIREAGIPEAESAEVWFWEAESAKEKSDVGALRVNPPGWYDGREKRESGETVPPAHFSDVLGTLTQVPPAHLSSFWGT